MRSRACSRSSVVAAVDEIRERAATALVLALFFDRQHLHGNVPGRRIQLEVVQHGPAKHVRQKDVERDRGRLVLLGEVIAACPRLATMPLNPLSRASPSSTRASSGVVVHDQQDRVPGSIASRSSGTSSSTFGLRTGRTPSRVTAADTLNDAKVARGRCN
jgi:hypothetical protein